MSKKPSEPNEKKQQHFVPKFYLELFTNENKEIQCLDKIKNESHIAHAKDICQKKYLYETEWENEKAHALQKYILQGSIEDYFYKRECEFAPSLKEIINRCTKKENRNSLICSSQEHRMICSFIVDLIVRNPHTINNEFFVEEEKKIKDNENIQAIDYAMKSIGFGDISTVIRHTQKTGLFGMDGRDETYKHIYNDLFKMNYTFLLSDYNFITSDCPVIYEVKNNKLVMAYFPLSPNVAIIFDDNDRSTRNRCVKISEQLTLNSNGQYLDYDLATLLISKIPFSLDSFPRVNKHDKLN